MRKWMSVMRLDRWIRFGIDVAQCEGAIYENDTFSWYSMAKYLKIDFAN